MHAADLLGGVEIGERAGDTQHAVIAACRQAHRVGGVAQQRKPGSVRAGYFFEYRSRDRGVGERRLQTERGVSRGLDRTRLGDAGGVGAGLALAARASPR